MQGYTLATGPRTVSDVSSVLSGKISIVSVFSGTWAERQTQSFVGEAENPALAAEVERLRGEGVVQRVWVNIEEDWMRAGLVRLFLGGLKRRLRRDECGRYFVVRRGVTDDMREVMAMANGKVGYVYLVDSRCKIRWAGSGDCWEGEGQVLVGVLRRLVERSRSTIREDEEKV